MNKVGEYTYVTEAYSLDFRGRVMIPTLGNYLLHAATRHATGRGFGYSDMNQKQTTWVLSRLALQMEGYPLLDEPIRIYTWIDEVSRLFTERCFEITASDGKTLGYARSIWAAIDTESRRAAPLDETALKEYLTDRPCPIARPGKIRPVEGETEGVVYRVKYSDLDVNGHLNSIKYMEHILDLFDLETFRTKEISRFEIAYQAEGRYGMDLSLHLKELQENQYDAAICNEGKSICRASIIWRPSVS
ncbi:acyl-[acyl-carrier-protein] thioesterase [Parabacteroides sp. Marseille-P3160]|uniref:acyl-[acyl-carrier-protein] thioesterase n=1 Tax=Parabacteroides sp. Marseille-P3160 TaxID=1917887 RepID=UPI0009BA9329|nr:acyl-ACP thioesterase domain-containing protein [Parabacteroides sp. Marseille-P3160]